MVFVFFILSFFLPPFPRTKGWMARQKILQKENVEIGREKARKRERNKEREGKGEIVNIKDT